MAVTRGREVGVETWEAEASDELREAGPVVEDEAADEPEGDRVMDDEPEGGKIMDDEAEGDDPEDD